MSDATSRHHLLAELDRIDTILEGAVVIRDDSTETTDSDATKSKSSERPEGLPLAIPAYNRDIADDRLAEIRDTYPRISGTPSRLHRLFEAFDLGRRSIDVLLLSLAPDIDYRFEDRYEMLHDAPDVAYPTVGLLCDIFAYTDTQRLAVTELVGPGSPLRRNDLIELHTPDRPSATLLDREIVVTERIVDYLSGHDALDPVLEGIATLDSPATSLKDLRVETGVGDRLDTLDDRETPIIHYFYGPEGSEKDRAVGALTDRVLRADLDAALKAGALDRLRREAILQDCSILLTGSDAATEADPEGPPRPTLDGVVAHFADHDCDLYLLGREQWTPRDAQDQPYAMIEFPTPGVDLRREIWGEYADEIADEVELDILASTFVLTQSGIDEAVQTAWAISDDGPLDRESLVTGCKAQSAKGLDGLAELIEPSATWDDIVLPETTERQLREVAAHVKHRGTIYESWGFEERFSRGTGVISMFAGPSGTGKTLAAEIIATDAGMDIYQINLSSVVSKYIGETEEKLEEVFAAARDSNAILLFDEADAVFGERAEVSDATDRYANAEVNYLLQRLESYDGVVLMTTNYESNIDTAFKRRIHQTVSFKRPGTEAREQIWRVTFPEQTPTENLDYEFLADLELTGGNIRNAAQTAAVLAADDGGAVQMQHVVSAIKREYDKLGKLLDPADFEQYRALLNGDNSESSAGPTATSDNTNGGSRLLDDSTSGVGTNGSSSSETPEEIVRKFVALLSEGKGGAAHELYHPRALVDELPIKQQKIREHKQFEITSDLERVREPNGRRIIEFDRVLWDDHDTVVYELREDDGRWRIFDFGLKSERNLHVG